MKFFLLPLLFFFCNFKINAQEITKQEKGYFNITEFGYFIGNNNVKYESQNGPTKLSNAAHALSLRNINGLFLTNKLSLGIGVGLDGYTFNNNHFAYHNTFLVFADSRYYLKNSKSTFFGFLDIGSSIAIADNIDKGLMFNIGIGYKFCVFKKAALNASLGYNNQYLAGYKDLDRWAYSSMSLKVGLIL